MQEDKNNSKESKQHEQSSMDDAPAGEMSIKDFIEKRRLQNKILSELIEKIKKGQNPESQTNESL